MFSKIKEEVIFPESSLGRVRWLNPADEEKFQSLLYSIYEDTYAYRNLYKKGGYAELLESGSILSFGEFSPAGVLIGHSAFIMKDPKQDYIESGLSLRAPQIRGFVSRSQQKEVWQVLLQGMSCYFNFIYQQTSTYHILAQTYALKNLEVNFCGLIVDYTQNEQLACSATSASSMQALMLVTCLPGANMYREVYLPEGPWGGWFKLIYDHLALPRSYNNFTGNYTSAKDHTFSSYHPSSFLELINYNSSLKLSRFNWAKAPMKKPVKNISLIPPPDENYLIHVPMDDLQPISFAWSILPSYGYIPVGIRPCTYRPDEMIFQYLGSKKSSINTFLQKIHLINNWEELVKIWHILTLQTL